MKQNRLKITLGFLFLLLILPTINKAQNVKFLKGSFEHIIQKSKTAKKPFLTFFYKKDCEACKDMKRQAFKDKTVKRYVKEHFLAVQIDVNDLDSRSWLKHFDIESFPTIIIFDDEGIVLERYDQILSDQGLLQELRKNYYVFENLNKPKEERKPIPIVNSKLSQGPEVVCLPKKSVLSKSLLSVSVSIEDEVEDTVTEELIQQPISISVAKPITKMIEEKSDRTSITTNISTINPIEENKSQSTTKQIPVLVNNITFEDQVVVVGVYKSYKESLVMLKKIRKESSYSIYVLPEEKEGKTIYKIMVGDLPNEEEAATFLSTLSAR